MNCKICGTDNPEDAVFCKACGKRLDGTAVCTACSASIPADSVFCPYCGTKQGQTQTQEPVKAEPVLQTGTTATVKTEKKSVKTFLKFAAPAAALMTALLALIFVFFTGYVKTTVITSGSNVSGSKVGVDLFFYFGDAYKAIAKGLEELDLAGTAYSDYFATASYLPAIFGTVVAALTLLAVCALSISAIVQGVMCILGKTKKTGGGLAVAAFFAYLAGALALAAIDNCNIKSIDSYSYSTQITTIGCKMNDATIAGVVLCAIFAFAYLAFNAASRGRELLAANAILKWVLTAVGIAVVIVVIALCNKPAFSFDSEENLLSEKVQIGGMYLITVLAVACMDWKASEAVLNLNGFTAFTLLSFIMLVLTIIFATRVLAGFTDKVAGKPSAKQIVIGSFLVVFAVLYLAFTVSAGSEFIKSLEYLEEFSKTDFELETTYIKYPMPIASLVLAVVAFAVSIVQFCLCRKKPDHKTVEADSLS